MSPLPDNRDFHDRYNNQPPIHMPDTTTGDVFPPLPLAPQTTEKNVASEATVPENLEDELKYPTKEYLDKIDEELKISNGIPDTDPGVNVIYYKNGWKSFGQIESFFMLLSLILLIYVAVEVLLKAIAANYGYENSMMFRSIAGGVAITTLIMIHDYFWHSTKSQEIDAFEDRLTGTLVAFGPGFNFRRPWLRLSETINFKKDEIQMSAKGDDSHLFTTSDPFECAVEWEVIARPIDSEDGIRHYLRYKKNIREARIHAMIESRISAIGGMNNFITILKKQSLFSAWISVIFGTEKEISPFEAELGMSISRPVIDNLHLTQKAAQLISESKATETRLREMLQKFMKDGLEASKAADLSKLALKLSTETVISYRGIENLKYFAPGGHGPGMVASTKDSNQ